MRRRNWEQWTAPACFPFLIITLWKRHRNKAAGSCWDKKKEMRTNVCEWEYRVSLSVCYTVWLWWLNCGQFEYRVLSWAWCTGCGSLYTHTRTLIYMIITAIGWVIRRNEQMVSASYFSLPKVGVNRVMNRCDQEKIIEIFKETFLLATGLYEFSLFYRLIITTSFTHAPLEWIYGGMIIPG